MSYTILGSTGFVGQNLLKALKSRNEDVFAPTRQVDSESLPDAVFNRKHKHLVYCIGLTADFRTHRFDTVEAHVCLLRNVLENCHYETITYLSSSRVYLGANSTHEETALSVQPADINYLYNLSKLTGESLCLNSGKPARVIRLSNIFGSENMSRSFLSSIFSEAARSKHIRFQTSARSAKDYISIKDVVNILPRIISSGKKEIYNLASGTNVSNLDISKKFNQLGISTEFGNDSPEFIFQPIDNGRMVEEFGPTRHVLLDEFENILESYKREIREHSED